MTKTSRLVELMERVNELQKFTADELAVEFGVSYRTMLRYLQELSVMGVPLYAEVGKHGGYTLLKTKLSNPLTANKPSKAGKIVIKPAFRLIGIDFKAPFTAIYMANVMIPRIWSELIHRKHELGVHLKENPLIGVVQNRQKNYLYIAGVEVINQQRVPEGMVSVTIPTQQYAVYTHHGSRERGETDETYFYALEMLRKEGYDHDTDAFCLEFYKQNTKELSSDMDIYIPIK